jgi:N-acetylglucosaminyldiphosphoundecaprenol N-acetyl-beta-D-mannosaminyltransferase
MFFFGAEPGVAARAADRLRAAEPALRIQTHHGYVQPSEMASVLERINASGASVLLVGLGDPLQQQWLAEHRAALRPRLLITCGGLFDWVSGENKRPPDWLVRGGLEWAWRLGLEPKRLARRYLLGNPAFMLRFAWSWLADRPH